MVQFYIYIRYNSRNYRYLVQHHRLDQPIEKFVLIARNKILQITSNRPFLRNKGLKHRSPVYKLIDGEVSNRMLLEPIFEAINKCVLRLEADGAYSRLFKEDILPMR
ncbi:MAG: hypothetical protein ICV81_17290 [Flavisolibacter sp.]|nr:hypothetical protein [Flavisolibacter sp.]